MWITDAWNWIDENSGVLTVLLAVIAVVPGVIAIRSAKLDSRDRTRPVIVAEIRQHPESERTLVLVVRNAGLSVARKVSVTFDPPLTNSTPTSHYAAYVKTMFAEQIRTLAPGQSLANPWYASHDQGAPEVCTITARYEDDRGRPYVDSYDISLLPYKSLLFIEASDSMKGRMKTLAGRLGPRLHRYV